MEEKLNKILDFCYKNTEYMWAATIVSIILECDFRDVKQKLDEYRKKRNEELNGIKNK